MFDLEGDTITYNGTPIGRLFPGLDAAARKLFESALLSEVSYEQGYDDGYERGVEDALDR